MSEGDRQAVSGEQDSTRGEVEDVARERRSHKLEGLVGSSRDLANSAFDRLQRSVADLTPNTRALLGPTLIFGGAAGLLWLGVGHGVALATPAGGSVLDGIREYGSIVTYILRNANSAGVLPEGTGSLQAGQAVVAPALASAFTILMGVCGRAALAEQSHKQK